MDYNPPNIYAVSPSVMSLTQFTTNDATSPPIQFSVNPITNTSVVFEPETWYETAGTEDPRVVYRESNKLYYLLYRFVARMNIDRSIPI
jgi:predicted GH43/DUF377 family glycosyl hydrolase